MAWSENSSLSPPHGHLSLRSSTQDYLFFIIFCDAMLQFFLVIGFADSVTPHYPSVSQSLIIDRVIPCLVNCHYPVFWPSPLIDLIDLDKQRAFEVVVAATQVASRTFALGDLLGRITRAFRDLDLGKRSADQNLRSARNHRLIFFLRGNQDLQLPTSQLGSASISSSSPGFLGCSVGSWQFCWTCFYRSLLHVLRTIPMFLNWVFMFASTLK